MKLKKVEKIIELEWNMFQRVENIGGRASCQEDFETFYIMRRSQYENWTDQMLDVWTNYVLDCGAEGRNLLSEKYARMMQYSDLHYYNKHLKHKLPATPVRIFRLINEIIEQMILNFDKRKEFGENARMIAKDNFNEERYYNKILDIYSRSRFGLEFKAISLYPKVACL